MIDEIPYSGSLVKYKACSRGAKVLSKDYVKKTLVSRLHALCLTSEPEYGNSSIEFEACEVRRLKLQRAQLNVIESKVYKSASAFNRPVHLVIT